MHRFTTSAVTERPFLGLLLLVELIAAGALIAWPHAAPSARPVALPVGVDTPTAASSMTTVTSRDGRTAVVMALGGAKTADLAVRIASEFDGATDAVTAFWGDQWPRRIEIVAAGSADEFQALVSGDAGTARDIAAATTAQRIVFAPGAAAMSGDGLRIVLRHELFHYAARADTAPDAPRWLTEGVADFVGRPASPTPGPARAEELAHLPTDDELDTAGENRTLAYDRGWWFSRFVAQRYGPATLRMLYMAACGIGHLDVDTAIRKVLGEDTSSVLTAWRAWLSG